MLILFINYNKSEDYATTATLWRAEYVVWQAKPKINIKRAKPKSQPKPIRGETINKHDNKYK